MPLGRLVAIALGICVVAGVITAIADKGKSEPATAAEAKQAAPTAASKPTKAKKPFHGRTVYVTMKGLAFAPKTIHIHIGDRVVWRNRDNVELEKIKQKKGPCSPQQEPFKLAAPN